jgi:hypothetical protein
MPSNIPKSRIGLYDIIVVLLVGIFATTAIVYYHNKSEQEKAIEQEKERAKQQAAIEKEEKRQQRIKSIEQARIKAEEDAKLPRTGNRDGEAFIICQNLIRNRLKNPSNAEFTLFDKIVYHIGDERYLVHSYVDAQNSFGATIRTKYWCNLRYTGQLTRGANALDMAQWQVEEIKTQP